MKSAFLVAVLANPRRAVFATNWRLSDFDNILGIEDINSRTLEETQVVKIISTARHDAIKKWI